MDDVAFFTRRLAQHRALAAAAPSPHVRAIHQEFAEAYELRLMLMPLARPEAVTQVRAELWL